jgi:hypothetical protein
MGKSRAADRNLESSEPEWDTTPLRMRAWWELLAEWLEDQDPDLPLWWSQGAVLDRNGTVSGPTNGTPWRSRMGQCVSTP